LVIDGDEVEAFYWDGGHAVSRIDPGRDFIDQLSNFGVDLSPGTIEIEYRKIGSSLQLLVIGVAMGGITGVLSGALLMKFYLQSRAINSA
jgi:hypothetical protein